MMRIMRAALRSAISKFWTSGDVTKLLLSMTSWIPSQRPDAQTVASTIANIIKSYDENFKTGVKVAYKEYLDQW